MNLIIDVGNSLVKVGGFENGKLKTVQSFTNEYEVLSHFRSDQIDSVILSTVKNETSFDSSFANKAFIRLDNRTPLPIKIDYKTPDSLGTDKIAAAVGAFACFPGTNCLIIDAGTCIKCDVLTKDGNYLGGSISPGLHMRFQSLNHFTAKLPLINIKNFESNTGQSTEESILNGVMNGALYEVEGFIRRYTEIFPQLNVILTGGDAGSFESKIKQHIFVIPNLVLLGLNKILLYNLSITSA